MARPWSWSVCRNREKNMKPTCLSVALLWTSLAGLPAAAATAVKVTEASLVIPTYEMGAPDRNPIFVERRSYQGAESPVYPYPMWDAVTDKRVDKTYRVVCLDNEYVQVCVLPEIGGRVLSARDKTNGYDFLYRQHVIKPALIGMVGAWISGGIEWNVPHHHRASTYMPVDYSVRRDPDGSASVRVGEIELRHRMRWIVELKLRPGSSCVEQTMRLVNRTAETNSFLYFSNIAVHANRDYQVIFPPDTHWVTNHGKREFSAWPVSKSIYNDIDFRKGVDVSWWKNHPSPVSMFQWGSQMDFVAGYDHGRGAGFVHVADHHISPGKKFFTWGAGESGRMWDRVLTEKDGPYVELMAGSYSDNQPDYSWIQPYQTKSAEMFWYPVTQIAGVKNANPRAAVNLERKTPGTVRIGVAVTSAQPAMTVRLSGGNAVVCEKQGAAVPGKAFLTECAAPSGGGPLTVRVLAGKAELVAYTEAPPANGVAPEVVRPPARPDAIREIEEVYVAAVRLEQLHSAALDPEEYYREVLRRDSGHIRANTAMGIRRYRRTLYAEAEQYLRAAVDRLTRQYLAPQDGEPHYYLGLTLRALGRVREAGDAFERAAWLTGQESAADYQLAELSSARDDHARALTYLDRALSGNGANVKALTLKAALLRKLGRMAEREAILARAMSLDPHDPWPTCEKSLARFSATDPEAYLEAASDYAGAGLWTDAAGVLQAAKGKAAGHALVHYSLGWYLEQAGKPEAAEREYAAGAMATPDYVFPFRRETLTVLRRARDRNPRDARAACYLGNLLELFGRKQEAIREWEESRALDPSYAIVHRNLALAYARQPGGTDRAISSMETALARDPEDARYYVEMDQLLEAAGAPIERRLDRLEKARSIVATRDDALARQIALLVAAGRLEDALELLGSHQFHIWEGAGRTAVHNSFVEAHLQLGHRHFAVGRRREAAAEYEKALEYPVNLGTGRPLRGERLPETYYYLGRAREATGDRDAAAKAFAMAVETGPSGLYARRPSTTDDPELYYFTARALEKCGRHDEAARLYAGMIDTGKEQIGDHVPMFFFASFGYPQSRPARDAQAHFTIGLGHLGANRKAEARAEFTEALRLSPRHPGAGKYMH
jgi:tetratricopeptide (TPR) repeat protein